MKSFLVTLILTSVTTSVTTPVTVAGSTPCNPVPLFRWRSEPFRVQNIVDGISTYNLVIDHIETTEQKNPDSARGYVKERKIATICSNHAADTVPLYTTGSFFHHSATGDPPDGIIPLGYVYTDAEKAGSGSFKVYQKSRLVKANFNFYKYLTTEVINEAADTLSNTTFLFYSLPKQLSIS
jgi:hypothetical protein